MQLLNATATFVNDMQMSREGKSNTQQNQNKTLCKSNKQNKICESTKTNKNSDVINNDDNNDDHAVMIDVSDQIYFIDVDGPVRQEDVSIIRYDVPFSRSKPIRSLRLRKRLMPD